MYVKIDDGNGGKKVWKKKFVLAAFSLLFGYAVMLYIMSQIEKWEVTDIVSIMGSLSAYTLAVLGPIYTADILDKKLNGGKYNNGEN